MRVMWKKNIIGNIIVLLVFGTLLVLYVTLLRYNRALPTKFNLVRKKRSIKDLFWGYRDPWAKLNQDVRIINIKGKHVRVPLDVYVLEEHQEVLPYWFEAARKKVIPKSGNILIHIDGHSDMAPPYYMYEFPFFRSPRDWKEVRSMMQRNDAFIIGASMGGLFKRVIWVWPFWDKPNHELPYINQYIDIGVAVVTNPKNKNVKEKVFCICERNMTSPERGCRYIPMEETSTEENDGREVSSDLCKTKKTIQYEEIREDKVLEKINTGKWLPKNDNYMLDIDEDYYGCVHASQPLLDVNMTMETIKLVNTIIEQLICPKSIKQEKLADDILVQALEIFKRPNHCNKSGKLDVHGLFPCKTDARVKEAEDLITKSLWSGRNQMACTKRKKHPEIMMINHLVDLFKHMTTKQIRVLEKVGFCLTTTLKSFQEISESAFHICHGANVPGMSVVLIHNPIKGEISLRTKVLKKILASIAPYRPKMVTLCRSVRDGYTPRRYFKQIENDVVKCLNSSFKHLRFNYDEGLLGGKNGWPNRHKTSKITKKSHK